MARTDKPLLNVLRGQATATPPVWMMRQAGRYLSEYRKLRAEKGSFLDLVYSPEDACEITLQPIRRFQMDGAILFSDILIVPHGLGQHLEFVEGTGPVLTPITGRKDLEALSLDAQAECFLSVARTLKLLSKSLPEEGFDNTTLIGFAGSPWTVACYMVEGGGSKEFLSVKTAAVEGGWFDDLIDLITQASIAYLKHQIDAGAEALQLFDSHAGVLDEKLFERYVIAPTEQIVTCLREYAPDIPIIGFPRGAGEMYGNYARKTGVNGLSLDPSVPLSQAQDLQQLLPVQGNLDPAYLLSSPDKACQRSREICAALLDGPHIFNLGHGVNKNTDPETVAKIVSSVRGEAD